MNRRTILYIIIYFFVVTGCKKEPFILPDTIEISTLEDWELYAPHLQDTEVINGSLNIVLESEIDLSILCNIKRVNNNFNIGGGLLNKNIVLKNLQFIGGNLSIGGEHIETVHFPKLEHIGNDLYIAGSTALKSIEIPNLNHCLAIIITDNPALETFKGADQLQELLTFVIQRNRNFRTIDGFKNLTYVQQTINFDLTMNMTPGSFENLTTVELTGIILFVEDENEYYYDWLKNISETPAINVNRYVSVTDLCPLKEFAKKYPDRIGGISWVEGSFSGLDIIEQCD